MLGTYHK